MSLYLHGLGHSHPDNVIDNQFLEALDIGTNESWIMERVGIRARRTVLSLDYIRSTRNQDLRASQEARTCDQAELGARAARMALERSGVNASEIGMVIGGSSAPDLVSPAQACAVAAKLGIEALAFDVASACTSFFVPLHLLSLIQSGGLPRFVLLVVTETMTCTVDYRDRAAAVLWGDGAAAAVISSQEPGRAEILETRVGSLPSQGDKVSIPRLGFFRQDGAAIQRFGIRTMSTLVHELQQQRGPGRAFAFVGHQANLRMLERVSTGCGIPGDRHFHNVREYGNTAAAGSPSVLSMRWDDWTKDDDVAVAGVGAGLTWGSYLLRFLA